MVMDVKNKNFFGAGIGAEEGSEGFSNKIGGLDKLKFPSLDQKSTGVDDHVEIGIKIGNTLEGKSQQQEKEDSIELKIEAAFDEIFPPQELENEISRCLTKSERGVSTKKTIVKMAVSSLRELAVILLKDKTNQDASLEEIKVEIRKEFDGSSGDDYLIDLNPNKKPEEAVYELATYEQESILKVIKEMAQKRKIFVEVFDDPIVVQENKEVEIERISSEAFQKSQEAKKIRSEEIWNNVKDLFKAEINEIVNAFNVGEQELNEWKKEGSDFIEECASNFINEPGTEIQSILEKIYIAKKSSSESDFELSEEERQYLIKKVNKKINEFRNLRNKKEKKIISTKVTESKIFEENKSGSIEAEIIDTIHSKIAENDKYAKGSELKSMEIQSEDKEDLKEAWEIEMENAIKNIADVSMEEFKEYYNPKIKPYFNGDYREVIRNVISYMKEHHIDSLASEELELFKKITKNVKAVNDKINTSKLIVVNGLTYKVEKIIKKGEFVELNQEQEKSLITVGRRFIDLMVKKDEEGDGFFVKKYNTEEAKMNYLKNEASLFLADIIMKYSKCSAETAEKKALLIIRKIK